MSRNDSRRIDALESRLEKLEAAATDGDAMPKICLVVLRPGSGTAARQQLEQLERIIRERLGEESGQDAGQFAELPDRIAAGLDRIDAGQLISLLYMVP